MSTIEHLNSISQQLYFNLDVSDDEGFFLSLKYIFFNKKEKKIQY